MTILGITGTIGSGKSEVARVFAEDGAYVIDADTEAKALLGKEKEGYRAALEAFGMEILDGEGNIDTKKLAEIVFSDPKKVEEINSIIHPLVHKSIMKKVQKIKMKDNEAVIVIDAPLLIEAGFQKVVDHLILVSSTDTERAIRRAAKRIGISVEEAKRRASYQIPLEEKERMSDIIIMNNGTLGALRKKAREVYRGMIKKEDSERV